MVYRAIGVLFNQPGVSISFSEFHENAGKWNVELFQSKTYTTDTEDPVSAFIQEFSLQFKVALINVHSEDATRRINGAAIAVASGLPVITDLALIDMELGGNGEFYKSCAVKLAIEERNIDDVDKSMFIAFMGILRWREEYNFLSSMTGAKRSSIGGAVWLGQEA